MIDYCTASVLARRLRDAYTDGAIAPLSDALDPRDSMSAYTVQLINTTFWRAAGRRVVGRKIGLTARAVQAQLGVDQPDFGVLFQDAEISDGEILPRSRVLQPKVEAEVAFVLARDIDDPEATAKTIVTAVEHAVAAIEIVDSRILDWRITLADTIADNASAGLYVLGRDPKSLAGLDLYTCGMAMKVNGTIVSIGAGAACLGHPLNAAAWLARTLAAKGEPLRAGELVLTGALGPMVAISPGDRIEAKIGGLGSVSFTCEAENENADNGVGSDAAEMDNL